MTLREKIRIRRIARQMVKEWDESEGEYRIPLWAKVRRSTKPEITGEFGYYVEAITEVYIFAGFAGQAQDA
jgi:hypothetical protein